MKKEARERERMKLKITFVRNRIMARMMIIIMTTVR